jgi:malonate transporter and related proteins
MLATFESILPIFLLILAGVGLRRLPIVADEAWPGLEQLAYWFLYPSLLFVTIYNADFAGLQLDALMIALIAGIAIMFVLVLGMWPFLDRSGLVAPSEFSSLFQTAVRWNGFMALAIAEKIFPAQGMAVVALVMAVIIIPINVASVAVVTHFAARQSSMFGTLRAVALNPLIVAAGAAVVLRFLPVPLYEPLNETLRLVGSAALGLGLVTIGAGLRLGDLAGFRAVLWLPTVLKLVVFPMIILALAMMLGIDGPQLNYLALCAAVPTAMNGYLLARQLGGDAPLYAAVTTMQTALSFFSIPLVLAVAAQLSSG